MVVEISRFYPSSKTCSKCGYVLEELSLDVRVGPVLYAVQCMIGMSMRPINILRVGASTLGEKE